MIERLGELRGLLEGRTMPCPNSYHAITVRDDTLPCPTCCGAGRVPDPKWAPMLKLFKDEAWIVYTDYWAVAPKGALAGALAEASVEVEDIQAIIAAWGQWFFSNEGPDQAAVDYWIKRLKAGYD